METRNATITGTTLTSSQHGVLSAWIILDYGGSGQSFGGYSLYTPKASEYHNGLSTAGHFIWRVMEIAGVENWEDIKGKTIRVKCDHTRVYAIGHIMNDDWFNPEEDFREILGEK